MSSVLWVSVLGWVLAVLSSTTLLPQLRRLFRTGSVEGLSVPTLVLATVTMWAWCCYTFAVSDWPAFASSAGPLVVWGSLTVAVLARLRGSRVWVSSSVLAVSLVVLPFSSYAVFVAVTGSVVWILPQGVKAARSSALFGVSIAAYSLILVENLGWVVYGAVTERWAYAVAPLVQIPVSGLVVWRAKRSRPSVGSDLALADPVGV